MTPKWICQQGRTSCHGSVAEKMVSIMPGMCLVRAWIERKLTQLVSENKMTVGSEPQSPAEFTTRSLQGRRSSVVEQLIRNQQVGGSIPLAGSIPFTRWVACPRCLTDEERLQ